MRVHALLCACFVESQPAVESANTTAICTPLSVGRPPKNALQTCTNCTLSTRQIVKMKSSPASIPARRDLIQKPHAFDVASSPYSTQAHTGVPCCPSRLHAGLHDLSFQPSFRSLMPPCQSHLLRSAEQRSIFFDRLVHFNDSGTCEQLHD